MKEAIALLAKIGAKCDLAAAYVQYGITLQANEQIIASQDYFQQAIVLYQQIQAPKQVERVMDFLHES